MTRTCPGPARPSLGIFLAAGAGLSFVGAIVAPWLAFAAEGCCPDHASALAAAALLPVLPALEALRAIDRFGGDLWISGAAFLSYAALFVPAAFLAFRWRLRACRRALEAAPPPPWPHPYGAEPETSQETHFFTAV